MAEFEDLEAEVQSMLDSVTDDEDHKLDPKKLELLKLQEAAKLIPPDPMAPVTDISGVPEFKAPDAPVANLPPKGQDRVPMEPVAPPPPPVDLGQLSKAQVRPEGFTPEPVGPANELDVILRDAVKPAPRGAFSPEVETAIQQASKASGYPVEFLRAAAKIESTGNPESNRGARTQYKGLYQFGVRPKGTWETHGQGDVYNARDNAMAMTRLLDHNKAIFKKAMGREPSLPELYLMHQQGPGFFTKGSLINAAGNLPPGARTAENMTHEGFRKWWTARVERAINEAGGSGRRHLPQDELRAFMDPTLTALQKPGLEKGGMETPGERGQVMALATGTPIEKIKAAVAKVNAGKAQGIMSGQTTVPARRAATSRVTHTDMPRGVLPGQTPEARTFPVPGMETGDFSMTTQATNPSVFSTIQAYQDMNRPVETAPQVKAPSDIQAEEETKSFIKNAMKIAQYLVPLSTGPVGAPGLAVRAITDAVQGTGPELPNLEQAEGFARGVGAGVASIPTNTYYGLKAFGQGAGGIFLDQPEWQGYSLENAQRMTDWQNTMKGAFGATGPGSAAGTFVGSNLSPNLIKTGINLAIGGTMEHLNPAIEQWAQSRPLGSIFPGQAQAATVFGRPPIIVNTPGGPVVANDATVQGFVIGGLTSMGFGLAPGALARTTRFARENPVMSRFTDPTREVPGSPGAIATSLPRDVLKAATVNPMQAIIDTVDRGKRYAQQAKWLGNRSGINKEAANEVYQTMRIQTRSGVENLAGQALTGGELKTDNFHYKVDVPLAKIHEFSEKNRNFPEYLRIRAIQDEIQANRGYNAGKPNAAQSRLIPPKIPRPESFTDHQNFRWNHTTAAAQRMAMEADHPEFRKVYQDYQANLAETRRFSSDGQYAPENPTDLAVKALSRPTLPIFSSTQTTTNMFNRILNGDNPLRFAEDNIKRAIMRTMSHDADRRYVEFSRGEMPDSFKEVTSDWVRDKGQVAKANGAILRRKENGEYKYYVGDPFVVSVLNNDSAAVTTLGKTLITTKRWFEQATTGKFAPWFAITSLTRSMGQGMVTAPPIRSTGAMGHRIGPAGPIAMTLGFGANVGPRAMNKFATPTVKFFEDLVRRSPLAQMIPPQHHNLISRTLERAYNDSFYNRMKLAGAYGPDSLNALVTESKANMTRLRAQTNNPGLRSVLDTFLYSNSAWARFLQDYGKIGSGILSNANKAKEAFAESAAFGWAYKAHGLGGGAKTKGGRMLSDAEVAQMMRDYTGDPMIKGNPWSKSMEGQSEGLRFSGTPTQEWLAKKAVGVGKTAHGWRIITPWAGVLVQSPSATLAALRDNPWRASAALVVSAVLPEVVAYMWNMHHGQAALAYAMDERGEHRNTHSIYLFNPDHPNEPWKGFEIPMPQEFILPRAMTRAFMNQYMGRSAQTFGTELADALNAFIKGGVTPPMPPLFSAGLGLSGISTAEGFFGMRQRREKAFDVTKRESNLELAWRNLMPTIADISIAAWTAGWTGPDADVKDFSPKNAMTGAVYRTQTRIPIIGGPGRLPASSAKTDELFKYQRLIDDLNSRYNKWDRDQGAIDPTKGRRTSEAGRDRIRPFVGPTPPTEKGTGGDIPVEGVAPPSTNPLYNLFMKEMMNTYAQDSPDKGGVGYGSLWKNYDIYKKKLDSMNATHAGTEAMFIKKMNEKMPKTKAYLEKNGIDPLNYREVRDFYANKVVKAQLRILQTIQATEQKFNKDPRIRKMMKPGQEFKLNMLNPYKAGLTMGYD